MTGISIQGVRKRYADTVILDDLDLEVHEGEFLAVVGPSGCGKSTLMRIVAGIEPLNAGTVMIGGEDVTFAHPGDRGIGMVFQDYALYPHLTVAGNLAFGLRAHRVPRDEVHRRVTATSRMVGLEPYLTKKPGQLSGGQQQRVALGRAMIREPRAYLMDEPLSNLDAALRVQMRAELIEFHQRVAGTVLYVTHDQVEAMTMGDRVAVMNGGRFEQIAAPTTIYEEPASLFVAGFLGSPRMNFLDATATVDGDCVRVAAGPLAWSIPAAAVDSPVPDSVVVAFRPEAVTREGGPADQAATFAATVALREYLGNETILHLDMDGHRVVSRLIARAGREPDTVPFRVDVTDLHLVHPDGPALWHGGALRALAGLTA
jgi:ABC-type sugar transport system ATPase subunit